MGRCGCDAAEDDFGYTESIAGTKDTAYIIKRSHTVKNDHQRQFFSIMKLLHADAVHLGYLELTIRHLKGLEIELGRDIQHAFDGTDGFLGYLR